MKPNDEEAKTVPTCYCTWLYNVVDKQTFFRGTFAIRYCPLHAAAPDLLAALERVMAYLSIHDPTYAESNADSVMAHAAIAKAKGVTP